jgi:hypothetical protein
MSGPEGNRNVREGHLKSAADLLFPDRDPSLDPQIDDVSDQIGPDVLPKLKYMNAHFGEIVTKGQATAAGDDTTNPEQ